MQSTRDKIIIRVKSRNGDYYTALGGEWRIAFHRNIPIYHTFSINDVPQQDNRDYTFEGNIITLKKPLYSLDLITVEPIDFSQYD